MAIHAALHAIIDAILYRLFPAKAHTENWVVSGNANKGQRVLLCPSVQMTTGTLKTIARETPAGILGVRTNQIRGVGQQIAPKAHLTTGGIIWQSGNIRNAPCRLRSV